MTINNLNGYQIRPATWNDLSQVVDLLNQAARPLIGRDEFTEQDYEQQWKTPLFNLETDTRIAVAADGKLAGYYEVWDTRNPPARIACWGRIHPGQEGQGLGTVLLSWAEARAQEAVLRAPPEIRIVLHAYVPHIKNGVAELMEAHGLQRIRHSLRMVIDLDQAPPDPVWPPGIVLRPIQPGDEAAVVHTIRDSFQDHWGHIETPFEEDLARLRHSIENDPDYDPNLFFLALEGERIEGISLCWNRVYDDPGMGWVGTLGVRREYRRRGLGFALLQHSLGELYRYGKARAGLGVDAGSLTGATRLYLKAGMRPDPVHQYDLYEKVLRPGIDITTQSLENAEQAV